MDKVITIQQAQSNERDAAQAFYISVSYTVPIVETDRVVLAKCGSEIIGVVRLCEEHSCLVLRGMEISVPFQRRGIGTSLLSEVCSLIGNRECWCLPYPHLESFYGQGGFDKVATEDAPEFLQKRVSRYLAEGMKNIVMKRKATYSKQI